MRDTHRSASAYPLSFINDSGCGVKPLGPTERSIKVALHPVISYPRGVVVLVMLAVAALFAPPSGAQGACLSQARAEDPYAIALPDCRAYEQVSPIEKNFVDALGSVFSVRGAPRGEAVTYNSFVPFPLGGGMGEGSSQLFTTYASWRGAEGWSTQNLEPGTDPGAYANPIGVTEDLMWTLVQSEDRPPLAPEPKAIEERHHSIGLRNNQTGDTRVLYTVSAKEPDGFSFVAAAAGDSRIYFESEARLVNHQGVVAGVPNLYEWHEGLLRLVDVLPEPGGGAPQGGGAAGLGPSSEGPTEEYFVHGAVSEDGSRVFFTDFGTGVLYVREPQAEKTIQISKGNALWQAATLDGSQAFYLEGGELYRFDLGLDESQQLTSKGAVLGVLGASNDGTYVYFAASAVLAHGAVPGAGNIYMWHEGKVSLVTSEGEEIDWAAKVIRDAGGHALGPEEGVRTSRVAADGRALMFTSKGNVVGYDNQGPGNDCNEISGAEAPCNEIYVYSVATGRVTCVSCNPSGQPATSPALLYHLEDLSFAAPPTLLPQDLTHNFSEDGDRTFFETDEALLPSDTNGEMDVYEWEREDSGSCSVGSVGGCLYLISSGQSNKPSYFAEADTRGSDVFFFTRQSLVGQDDDELIDVYDAREDGGIASQNASATVAPCLGEACRAAQAPSPVLGVPVSQVFSGPGNLGPHPEGKVVVKPKHKAKKAKAKTPSKKRGRRSRKASRHSKGGR